jgi:CheY-like chemotaxis protein
MLLKEAIADTDWKADVSEACNGQQAFSILREAALQQAPPDLVLLDYRLTNETCLEVIQSIRGMRGYESIPIIVISTTTLPEVNRQQMYSRGVLKILMKACDYVSLMKMVKTLRKILEGKGEISRGGSWISDSDLALLGDG